MEKHSYRIRNHLGKIIAVLNDGELIPYLGEMVIKNSIVIESYNESGELVDLQLLKVSKTYLNPTT